MRNTGSVSANVDVDHSAQFPRPRNPVVRDQREPPKISGLRVTMLSLTLSTFAQREADGGGRVPSSEQAPKYAQNALSDVTLKGLTNATALATTTTEKPVSWSHNK